MSGAAVSARRTGCAPSPGARHPAALRVVPAGVDGFALQVDRRTVAQARCWHGAPPLLELRTLDAAWQGAAEALALDRVFADPAVDAVELWPRRRPGARHLATRLRVVTRTQHYARWPLLHRAGGGDGPGHRAAAPLGVVYRRQFPRLGLEIGLRALDIEADLERFHGWMNQPRVARYWQEQGSREAHREYLQRLAADEHALGLIGLLDGRPVAFFQIYWCAEDRLGAHYPAAPFDRGAHLLVGEREGLGRERSAALMRAVLHYMLLDEPRTTAIYGEPDHRNTAVRRLAGQCGFECLRLFDFPHKRAALLRLEREHFMQRVMR